MSRIRWTAKSDDVPGYGTVPYWVGGTDGNDYLFLIAKRSLDGGDYSLNASALPGMRRRRSYGTDPDKLKAEAERWLEEFVPSLGAVFPDRPAKVEQPADCRPGIGVTPGFPVIPAAQIQAEVAADVHRLTHPVETGQPWRSAAEADWDESR